jgi:hypothetical protein
MAYEAIFLSSQPRALPDGAMATLGVAAILMALLYPIYVYAPGCDSTMQLGKS